MDSSISTELLSQKKFECGLYEEERRRGEEFCSAVSFRQLLLDVLHSSSEILKYGLLEGGTLGLGVYICSLAASYSLVKVIILFMCIFYEIV